jgi:transcriptional regulator
MYIPRLNRISDMDVMISFMRNNNFAIVISAADPAPVATHVPLIITQNGADVRIRTHLARANTHWQSITQGETLVIFSGPHAYISPRHYDAFESVPTWNYISVHAYGNARLIDFETQPEELEVMLMEIIDAHEPRYKDQWEQLSQRYKDGMKQGIIGVEIEVTRLEGKAKLSQNKTASEQERIADSLLGHADGSVMQIGYAMKHGQFIQP